MKNKFRFIIAFLMVFQCCSLLAQDSIQKQPLRIVLKDTFYITKDSYYNGQWHSGRKYQSTLYILERGNESVPFLGWGVNRMDLLDYNMAGCKPALALVDSAKLVLKKIRKHKIIFTTTLIATAVLAIAEIPVSIMINKNPKFRIPAMYIITLGVGIPVAVKNFRAVKPEKKRLQKFLLQSKDEYNANCL